jgi:hypothetical protein
MDLNEDHDFWHWDLRLRPRVENEDPAERQLTEQFIVDQCCQDSCSLHVISCMIYRNSEMYELGEFHLTDGRCSDSLRLLLHAIAKEQQISYSDRKIAYHLAHHVCLKTRHSGFR